MYKWDCIATHGYIPSHLESIWRHLLFIQVSLKSYSAAQLLSVWVTADTLSSWVFSTCNNHTAKEVKGVAQGHTVSNCRWRSRSRCYINKHLKQMMKPDSINSQHPSGDTGGFYHTFYPMWLYSTEMGTSNENRNWSPNSRTVWLIQRIRAWLLTLGWHCAHKHLFCFVKTACSQGLLLLSIIKSM